MRPEYLVIMVGCIIAAAFVYRWWQKRRAAKKSAAMRMQEIIDTLVVQTTGFRDGGWLDVAGSPALGQDAAAFLGPRYASVTLADGNVIEVELLADAFCHNMVRSIVGALIAAGEGKASPADVAATLARRTRVGSYKVQPPRGLTLIGVGYPDDDQLAIQAERARNMRSLDEN